MNIKRIIMLCCIVAAGAFLAPTSSLAYHSFNYYYVSSSDSMCTHCHPGGPGNHIPACTQCHDTAIAPPYSVDVAPYKQTHSNAVIGSDKYGDWARVCLDCHEPHHNNGITSSGVTNPDYKLVEFTGRCTETGGGETTMSISDLVINDPAWSDPARWVDKTSAERGLVLLDVINGKTYWYKVLSASETSITFKNEHTYFPSGGRATDQYMSLVYGQFIKDEVNGTAVTFGGYRDMAKNESMTDFDSTPDGICQVCHTQTDYWRNDGTRADHFNGWRCTLCHLHDQGFKAVTPEGCICPEGESCNQ
jgi:hypothetical protein